MFCNVVVGSFIMVNFVVVCVFCCLTGVHTRPTPELNLTTLVQRSEDVAVHFSAEKNNVDSSSQAPIVNFELELATQVPKYNSISEDEEWSLQLEAPLPPDEADNSKLESPSTGFLPKIERVTSVSSNENLKFCDRFRALMRTRKNQFFYSLPLQKQLKILKCQNALVDQTDLVALAQDVDVPAAKLEAWFNGMKQKISKFNTLEELPHRNIRILNEEFNLSEDWNDDRALMLSYVLDMSIDMIHQWFDLKQRSKSRVVAESRVVPETAELGQGNEKAVCKRFTANQSRVLMTWFKHVTLLCEESIQQLTNETGLESAQVCWWFEKQLKNMRTSSMNQILQKLTRNWQANQLLEMEKEYRKCVSPSTSEVTNLRNRFSKSKKKVLSWFKYRRMYELYKIHGTDQAFADKFERTRFILELKDVDAVPAIYSNSDIDWYHNVRLLELLTRNRKSNVSIAPSEVNPPLPGSSTSANPIVCVGPSEVNHSSAVTSISTIQNISIIQSEVSVPFPASSLAVPKTCTIATEVNSPLTASFLPTIPNASIDPDKASISDASSVTFSNPSMNRPSVTPFLSMAQNCSIAPSEVNLVSVESVSSTSTSLQDQINEPNRKQMQKLAHESTKSTDELTSLLTKRFKNLTEDEVRSWLTIGSQDEDVNSEVNPANHELILQQTSPVKARIRNVDRQLLFSAFQQCAQISPASIAEITAKSMLSTRQIKTWFYQTRRRVLSISNDLLHTEYRNEDLTREQVDILEAEFRRHPYEDESTKTTLATELKISKSLVKRWFSRRRDYELLVSSMLKSNENQDRGNNPNNAASISSPSASKTTSPSNEVSVSGYQNLYEVSTDEASDCEDVPSYPKYIYQLTEALGNKNSGPHCENIPESEGNISTIFPDKVNETDYSVVMNVSEIDLCDDVADWSYDEPQCPLPDYFSPKRSPLNTFGDVENCEPFRDSIQPNKVNDDAAGPSGPHDLPLQVTEQGASGTEELFDQETESETFLTTCDTVCAPTKGDPSENDPSQKIETRTKKIHLSPHQRFILISEFQKDQHCSSERAAILAHGLNLPARVIEFWFKWRISKTFKRKGSSLRDKAKRAKIESS